MPQHWQAQVSQSVTDCTYFQTSTLLDEPKFTFSLKRVQEMSEIWSKVTVTLPVWDSLLLDKSRFPTEPHYRRGVYIIGRLTDFKQFLYVLLDRRLLQEGRRRFILGALFSQQRYWLQICWIAESNGLCINLQGQILSEG